LKWGQAVNLSKKKKTELPTQQMSRTIMINFAQGLHDNSIRFCVSFDLQSNHA
jgi:hypothetical protein